MKTVVLFSRCELVHFYGQLSPILSKKYKIIHVAYSNIEGEILERVYSIYDYINFSQEVKQIHAKEEYDPEFCSLIDSLIIDQSKNRFNLNSAIQSDRTYKYVSYKDSLVLAQTYYKFWEKLISGNRVDYLIHEPTALFFSHIAAIICRKNGSKYVAQIQVYGENRNSFMIVEADSGICFELLEKCKENDVSELNYERVSRFLLDFRKSREAFFSEISKRKTSLLQLVFTSLRILLSSFKVGLTIKNRSFSSLDHLKQYFAKERSVKTQLSRLWGAFFINYDVFDASSRYFYYPMHLEPEAVVLYWGDGIYKNQVKLIENIAAQLPANSYLFVKDHPHAIAYRDAYDYKKIKSIPNVKLLNPKLSGKDLIGNSIGVITINGTSGFEALLLNKKVYTLGNCYYNCCKRVTYIRNIRDLRRAIYDNQSVEYKDDEVLYEFVSNYLNSIHNGFSDYFLNYPKVFGIDERKNAELVAKGLSEYFN